MTSMDRGQTLALMAVHGIRPNRHLGQNFLVDGAAAERIAALSGAGPDDIAVEAGPGLGALTDRLAARVGHVLAVEIDRGLIPALREGLQERSNVSVVYADFLTYDLVGGVAPWLLDRPGSTVHVAANVPYYITTPILRKVLTELPSCLSMVFLVQKEAAARLLAKPGSGEYGPLAVCLSAFYDARMAMRVPPHAFYPQPGVDSVVVQARLRQAGASLPRDIPRAAFLGMVDAAFSHRRKHLFNSMQSSGKLDSLQVSSLRGILLEMGLKEACRAEELDAEMYIELYRRLSLCK